MPTEKATLDWRKTTLPNGEIHWTSDKWTGERGTIFYNVSKHQDGQGYEARESRERWDGQMVQSISMIYSRPRSARQWCERKAAQRGKA